MHYLLMVFEYISDGFGLSIMVPIPKSESNMDKSENYRGLSIIPLLSKVFEH